jgi:hypothetical protein
MDVISVGNVGGNDRCAALIQDAVSDVCRYLGMFVMASFWTPEFFDSVRR